MGMRRWLKSFAGRKGGATHNGTPGSHVNTKRNKQSAHKAERLNWRQELQNHLDEAHHKQFKAKAPQFITVIDGGRQWPLLIDELCIADKVILEAALKVNKDERSS